MDIFKERVIIIPSPFEAELRSYAQASGERHGYLISRRNDISNTYLCDALYIGARTLRHSVDEMVDVKKQLSSLFTDEAGYFGIVVHTSHVGLSPRDRIAFNAQMWDKPEYIALIYQHKESGCVREIVKPHKMGVKTGLVRVEVVAPSVDFEVRKRNILSKI